MDRLEEIRQRTNEWRDQFMAECDTIRVDETDLRALLDIAAAALEWWRAERRFDETKQDSRDYVVAAKAYVLFNEACSKWEAK